ncbi:MAG: BLUF domain-containing protein [Burkholderiales bacterium]|nr:BLUF domain-containing protein [Burkholderiales bacterium]
MLAHLLYTSAPSSSLQASGMTQVIDHARIRNRERDITGMLVWSGDAILQVLEGDIDAISALFARIEKDTRHRDVVLLAAVKADRGRFWRWPMGFARIGPEHGDLLVRSGGSDQLAPLQMNIEGALDLLEELAKAQPEDPDAGVGRPL